VVPCRAAALFRREQLPETFSKITSLVVTPRGAWPKYPDFIDGRGNNPDLSMEQFNLYSEDQIPRHGRQRRALESECSAGCDGQPSWLANMDAYKFCQSASWRPVYMDDVSLVFLRKHPAILR